MTGKLPLHTAAVCGHEKVVEQILACKSDLVHATDKRGDTALAWACYKAHPKVVASLLAHGAVPSPSMAWEALEHGADDSRIAQVLKLIHASDHDILGGTKDKKNMLHLVFNFQVGRGERRPLHSEELMKTVWELSPEAVLHETNYTNHTPFHIAIQSDNEFAIGLVQWKLSINEIVDGFAKFNKKCPLLESFRESLQMLLSKDVAGTVWEYLGIDNNKLNNNNNNKRPNNNKRKCEWRMQTLTE